MAKLKNIEALCSFCGTVTKMELSGDVGNMHPTKIWAKCKKCRQVMMVDQRHSVKETKASRGEVSYENSMTYSPAETYKIGDAIYHESWDDFGIVKSKHVLSSGKGSIVVDFDKNGSKTLLETIHSS